MSNVRFHRALLTAAALSALSTAAIAAPLQPSIPSTVQPGHVEQDLNQKLQPQPGAPPVEMTAPAEAQAPAGAEKIVFTLKSVSLTGSNKIKTGKLEQFWQGDIGHEISLTRVYEIAGNITRYYRDHGYILSRALVPQQEIKDGNVQIQIVEGFISGYNIQGPKDLPARKQIEKYAKKIASAGTLDSATLERYLLLMNDIPGTTVRAIISPSAAVPGGADLTLVPTHRDLQGTAGIDNYGSSYLGPVRLNGTLQFNDLFYGQPDQLSVTGLIAPQGGELYYIASGYRHVVNDEGTRVGFDLDYTHAEPSLHEPLRTLQTNGDAYTARFLAEHPFIRQRAMNLNGDVSFEFGRERTMYAPAFNTLDTEDDTRVFRLGANGNLLDSWGGYNTISLQGSQGVVALGSTRINDADKSRAAGDPGFTKFGAEATRLQRIYGPFSALAGIVGQYSFDPLLTSEEFALGGTDYGRGYDASQITGDHGLGGKVELIYNGGKWSYADNYQLYTFYDVGTVWRREPGAGENRDDSIASTGVGTRTQFTDYLNGDLFVAKPLTLGVDSRGRSSENDWRVQGALTTRF